MKREMYNLEVCPNGHVASVVPSGVFMDTIICQNCKIEVWDSNYCGRCGNKLGNNESL